MIIDGAIYREGQRYSQESTLEDLRQAIPGLDEDCDFLWIGLYEPTHQELESIGEMLNLHKLALEDVVESIGEMLNLHKLALEDVVESHQRPKIERYSDHVFVVLKTLWYGEEGDAVETGEINAFLGKHYFVTVRQGHHQLADVRHSLEEQQAVLGHGPAAALYAVMDSIVDQYEVVAAELQTDIEEVEVSVFSADRTSDSDRIYRLKREVMEFRRAIMPLRQPMQRIVEGQFDFIPEQARPFFRDVADHLARVADDIDSIDHLLDNALNAHLARLSLQQNEDMRKLAAGATLFAVPTMIAGIYGMNFEHIPELGWTFGYPLCVAVILVACVVIYGRFRRSGWL